MVKGHNRRQTGGAAGKRGARYEDYFAACKLIAFTPTHLRHNRDMRMREQTGGPVDDLAIRTWRDEFYQLKDAQQVSWTAQNRKLAREFKLQNWICKQPGPSRPYRLMLIVSDVQVRRRLQNTMPKSIRAVTSLIHFASVARPADFAQPGNKLEPILRSISAASKPGLTDLQHIAVCFHAAWVNHVPDVSGFCVYSTTLAFVRGMRAARIRARFVAPPSWAEAQLVLAAVPGFSYDVSRGYFEWEYPPTDRGLSGDSCDSPSFARFVQRVIADLPSTFDDLEVLLP